MKLLRPRKRRRCNSNSDSTSITTRSNSNKKTLFNGKIGRRRSKRNESLMIDLRVAKQIVEQACIAAAASLDNIDNTSAAWDDNGNTSVRCNISNPTETEFFDFVSSAVAGAMEEAVAKRFADANANTKQLSPAKATTNKGRRPRKRPRTLESKVEGLEHAESLHTMCSLFPIMATVESLSSPQLLKDPVVMAVPMTSAVYDADHSASPKDRELELEACDTVDAAVSSPESSDHNSLLPPVGATPTKAATADTKITTTIGETSVSVASAQQSTSATTPTHRQHQQEQSSTTKAPPPAPLAIDTTNNNSDTSPLAQTPRSRCHSHSQSLAQSHNHKDDDCDDYDRPLIGVAGDEGSGIERHRSPTKIMIMNGGNNKNDLEIKNKNNSKNDNDNDAIISLTKVGSVVCRMMGLGIAGHSQLDY